MKSYPDPYRHFENLDSAETQNFAAEANSETRARFLNNDKARALSDGILAQMQDTRQIPFCQEHRARMYHFHQDAEYPKGVYRVCTAATYRSGYPEWKILFSVADFDELLGDDVYLGGVSHLVEQPNRALLTLSKSGGDAAYTLEVDLEAGELVEGGFHFPAGKNHVSWRDENSVWVCPAWDERQLTESGYPREVWLVERGKSFEESLPVYQIDKGAMMVNAWRYLDPQGSPIDLIEASDGFYTKTYLQVSAEGEAKPLNLPNDCDVVGYLAGHLLLTLRKDWHRANQSYPSGALVAVKLNRGEIGAAQLLFAPDETQALESVETTKRFVVASLLENVQGRLKAWRFTDGKWQETELPRLPSGALEMTDQPWGGRRSLPCRQRFHHAADAVCAGFERDGTDRHAPPAAAVRFRRHRSAAVLDDFSRRRAHSLFPRRQKRRARHADLGLCLWRFRHSRIAALSGQHRQILA